MGINVVRLDCQLAGGKAEVLAVIVVASWAVFPGLSVTALLFLGTW